MSATAGRLLSALSGKDRFRERAHKGSALTGHPGDPDRPRVCSASPSRFPTVPPERQPCRLVVDALEHLSGELAQEQLTRIDDTTRNDVPARGTSLSVREDGVRMQGRLTVPSETFPMSEAISSGWSRSSSW